MDKKILHTEAHLPYSDFIRRLKKEVDGLTAKLDAKTPILHIGAGHHQKKGLKTLGQYA
ncbi:hypothetical protein [Pricia antarctica]|uniref:hypothetical protein n=1 Tax=Pricia antarctica TaxID=641691 RepID=UPI0015873F6E|nr:hypothetical protein [Pricia antarctica]